MLFSGTCLIRDSFGLDFVYRDYVGRDNPGLDQWRSQHFVMGGVKRLFYGDNYNL